MACPNRWHLEAFLLSFRTTPQSGSVGGGTWPSAFDDTCPKLEVCAPCVLRREPKDPGQVVVLVQLTLKCFPYLPLWLG